MNTILCSNDLLKANLYVNTETIYGFENIVRSTTSPFDSQNILLVVLKILDMPISCEKQSCLSPRHFPPCLNKIVTDSYVSNLSVFFNMYNFHFFDNHPFPLFVSVLISNHISPSHFLIL